MWQPTSDKLTCCAIDCQHCKQKVEETQYDRSCSNKWYISEQGAHSLCIFV